jgi:DNA-binding NarL/FixJ family response regulator
MESGKAIRVVAVEHNPLMREGLALLVRLHSDMQLVGVVGTPQAALQLQLEQTPDVMLMDLDPPSKAAIEAIRQIRARHPAARIIGLTTYESDPVWKSAIAAGAVHCLAKDRLGDSLPQLIRNGAHP